MPLSASSNIHTNNLLYLTSALFMRPEAPLHSNNSEHNVSASCHGSIRTPCGSHAPSLYTFSIGHCLVHEFPVCECICVKPHRNGINVNCPHVWGKCLSQSEPDPAPGHRNMSAVMYPIHLGAVSSSEDARWETIKEEASDTVKQDDTSGLHV